MRLGNLHNHTSILLCAAFIMGYAVWSLVSYHQIITVSLKIPLCFFGTKESISMAAQPEYSTVIMQAKRADLVELIKRSLAFHIDSDTLNAEQTTVALNKELLLLPNTITVVDIIPQSCGITLEQV